MGTIELGPVPRACSWFIGRYRTTTTRCQMPRPTARHSKAREVSRTSEWNAPGTMTRRKDRMARREESEQSGTIETDVVLHAPNYRTGGRELLNRSGRGQVRGDATQVRLVHGPESNDAMARPSLHPSPRVHCRKASR